MKIKEIASRINCEVIGDPNKEVENLGYLHTATSTQLAYCFLRDDLKDIEAIKNTSAGAVICEKHLKNELRKLENVPVLILSECPKYHFAEIAQEYFVEEKPFISDTAVIEKDVVIGKNVQIHHNAVVHNGTIIGDNVIVRANCVLGAEGLDYGKNPKGKLKRLPHISQLVIGQNVHIGSNTTVQKGVLRPTSIGEDTKIGPNCNIGHEVTIGKRCTITGMTMIAGATEIGDNTYIAPYSTIKNSIKLGRNVFVGIGSLVLHDIPDNQTVVGRPAIPIERFRWQRERLKKLLEEDE
jgi:UDP-3-O-[3-hydroxymyristoyl] glucosamine N-acyltransferase